VAQWLEQHPTVTGVVYPGLPAFPQAELARRQLVDPHGVFAPGMMIYFEIDDPAHDGERGARMMDFIGEHAYAITRAVSLGQVKSLIEHPYSMTHSALPVEEKARGGLHPGGVRLSVGLEDPSDLVADLDEALGAA
jgi:methionine-gamma-lyase